MPKAYTRQSWQDPCSVNRTYLTIGQDLFSIQEYVTSQYNASLHSHNDDDDDKKNTRPMKDFFPAATMFYTDIQNLKGMDTPIDYGSGIEYAKGLAEAYPKSGIQIGLWLNGTQGCRDIVNGNLTTNIYHMFHSILQWKVPKVFLRVGYEFDNPYFGYSEDPSVYQDAFRRIVLACENQLGWSTCHEKIDFVWHSWAAPRWISNLNDFYPGDDYVDWVGISIFQQLYPWSNDDDNNNNFAGGSMEYVHEVLQFAKLHNDKPVMIAESMPFGGVHWDGHTFDHHHDHHPSETNKNDEEVSGIIMPNNIWDLWFIPILQLIEEYDIRMWSYINCDWNSQPMWYNIGFGDSRLSTLDYLMVRWKEYVLDNPRFITSLSNEEEESTSSSSCQHSSRRKRRRRKWGKISATTTTTTPEVSSSLWKERIMLMGFSQDTTISPPNAAEDGGVDVIPSSSSSSIEEQGKDDHVQRNGLGRSHGGRNILLSSWTIFYYVLLLATVGHMSRRRGGGRKTRTHPSSSTRSKNKGDHDSTRTTTTEATEPNIVASLIHNEYTQYGSIVE